MMTLYNYLKVLVMAILLPCFFVHAEGGPEQIGPVSTLAAEDPCKVAVDAQGNALAVQVVNGAVLASRRPFNGAWSAPVVLSASSAKTPQIAVNANGDAVAIWVEDSGLRTSIYTSGRGWSPSSVLENAKGLKDPQVRISGSGNVIAAWLQEGSPCQLRYATKSTVPAPWSSPANIASAASASSVPFHLAISDNGSGLIAWSFKQGLQARSVALGGALSAVSDLTSATNSIGAISGALDPNGNGVVLWAQGNTIHSAVFANGSWFLTGTIPGTEGISGNPSVAVDTQGNAVAVWRQTGAVQEIHSALLPFNTGVWQNATTLSDLTADADFPKVATDGVGNAAAIWVSKASSSSQVVQAATLPVQTLAWSPAMTLSASGSIVNQSADLSVNEAGNVLGAWLFSQATPSTTAESNAYSIPSTSASTIAVTQDKRSSSGTQSATILVTMKDGNEVPLAGNTVVLTQSGSATISPASSGITNGSGQVTFTLRSSSGQPVTVTAADQKTCVGIGSSQVDFLAGSQANKLANPSPLTPGVTDPTLSTVIAAPPSVQADGVAASLILVTLLDSTGAGVIGHSVQLSQNGGASSTISPNPQLSGPGGLAVFSVKDTVVENVTYTATDTTDGVVITQQATVSFTARLTDATKSTIGAVPTSAIADGVAFSTVTVTLLNMNSVPVVGHTVSLGQNGSSTITPLTGITNASGQVSFTVKDLVSELVTYTATDQTNSVQITATANVNFTPRVTDPGNSTIVAVPTNVIADGIAFSTVTVTLLDVNNVPVPGHQVSLGQNGSSTIAPPIGVTNASGQVAFSVRDLVTEVVTYTATDLTDSITITNSANVSFDPRTTNPSVSTVVAHPTSVVADGVQTSTITVTLKNVNGVPVVGHSVTLAAGSGSSVISAPSGLSDSNGIVTFTVKDTVVEDVTYTATDTTDSVAIAQTATVHFTSIPPAPPSNFEGVVKENKFATQQELTDVLTWTPSPDPSVVSYRIYVNGVLERTIPADGPFKAVFKFRCDNKQYVYRLVAVSNTGLESEPLFVTLHG